MRHTHVGEGGTPGQTQVASLSRAIRFRGARRAGNRAIAGRCGHPRSAAQRDVVAIANRLAGRHQDRGQRRRRELAVIEQFVDQRVDTIQDFRGFALQSASWIGRDRGAKTSTNNSICKRCLDMHFIVTIAWRNVKKR